MVAGASFRETFDGMPELQKALEALKNNEVLIGIPEEKSSRKKEIIRNSELLYIHTHGIRKKVMREEMQKAMDSGSTYNKAYQMYLHEHGSALWHAPPRPVLEPAIAHEKDKIAEQMQKAAAAYLDGNIVEGQAGLQKAGMVGQNAARDWFTNPANGWPPNSESTINGWNGHKGKGSDKPLIDTGQLRKAITYVLRKRGEQE